MMNYIGCLIASIVGLLLSKSTSLGIREAKILTILGWAIALYLIK